MMGVIGVGDIFCLNCVLGLEIRVLYSFACSVVALF
jgi:hypothetical protein